MPNDITSMIGQLLSEKSGVVTALLLFNGFLATLIWRTLNWHRKDREEDRARWIDATEKHTQQLVALTEAITQLRIMVSQCSLKRGR